jgi:profilin
MGCCSLVGTGHIDKAAIISAAGDSVWASSADLQVKIEQFCPCRSELSTRRADGSNNELTVVGGV